MLSLLGANRSRILIAAALCVSGMNSACIFSGQSGFFSGFSMRELVSKANPIAGLDCGAGGRGGIGGGSGGGTIGSWGRGGGHFSSHKDDAVRCRLTSASTSFDEAVLLGSLKQQVEKSLRDYGATIKESADRESRSFSLSYTIQDIQGRVQLSGTRIGGDFYSLHAELEESK